MPPLPTEKFQPIYSPTSTMPTPSAQTWTGPSTLSRLRRFSCAVAVPVAVDMLSPSDFVAFLGQLDLAFARGGEQLVVIGRVNLPEVVEHVQPEGDRQGPGEIFEYVPQIHCPISC